VESRPFVTNAILLHFPQHKQHFGALLIDRQTQVEAFLLLGRVEEILVLFFVYEQWRLPPGLNVLEGRTHLQNLFQTFVCSVDYAILHYVQLALVELNFAIEHLDFVARGTLEPLQNCDGLNLSNEGHGLLVVVVCNLLKQLLDDFDWEHAHPFVVI
jgi:hypothetical protein